MKDSQIFELFITDKNDLNGLPEGIIEAAHLLGNQKESPKVGSLP